MTLNTGNIQISEFSILGLHGNKNIRLKLEDNTLILVGANGTYKTTILTLFYSFLAGDVEGLAKYIFDSLEMVINEKSYSVQYTDIEEFLFVEWIKQANLPSIVKRELLNNNSLLSKNTLRKLEEEESLESMLSFLSENKAPVSRERSQSQQAMYHYLAIVKEIKKVLEPHNIQFLYLPTYRRIEEKLQKLDEPQNKRRMFSSLPLDKEQDETFCRKIIEFGMEDIQKLLENKIKFLKNKKTESETYLKNEFAEMAYDEEVYQNISKDDFEKYSSDLIQKVFDRIKKDEQIKPKLRSSLLDPHILEVEESKSLKTLHILKRYIESYQKTFEYEEPLNQLCEACNRYLHSNEIVYDPTEPAIYIRNRKTSENSLEHRIELSQLSSGEKQLVSLFTHLYLADGTQYFVIIDEPEISLSVEWQETFLEDIRNGTFCSGLFVATHSPFMFDNSLRKYAHGVGRFLEVVEPSDDKQ